MEVALSFQGELVREDLQLGKSGQFRVQIGERLEFFSRLVTHHNALWPFGPLGNPALQKIHILGRERPTLGRHDVIVIRSQNKTLDEFAFRWLADHE